MEHLREISDVKGLWRDKETGKVAEVISATDDAVWYLIPEWSGPQNCSRKNFEAAMEPVTDSDSRPSERSKSIRGRQRKANAMKCPICKKSDEVVTRPDGPYCLDCGRAVLGPSDATACSRLRCEECNTELPASREETPVLTAVKAKNAGVWVKNFIIYGDESGYHYFCCPDHGKAWRDKNIPSANDKAVARQP